MSLVARAKWSAEQVGRPRKDVITRAREIVMAIFIDSYYRCVGARGGRIDDAGYDAASITLAHINVCTKRIYVERWVLH